MKGALSPLNETERKILSEKEVKQGFRLACQARLKGDAEVYIPSRTLFQHQVKRISNQGKGACQVHPVIRRYVLKLPPPRLNDIRSDTQRITDENNIAINKFDISVIRSLSKDLRNSDWQIAIYERNGEIIKVEREDDHKEAYGLAIDLGSSNIGIFLLDLFSGETLIGQGIINPQIVYGGDIISRIQYILEGKPYKGELRHKVVSSINETIEALCKEIKISPDDILEATIVGNTAMHHIFLDLPLEQLVRAPFVCATNEPLEIKARDLRINIYQGGYIYFPPLIGGFIGSDHTAMILASRLYQKRKICLGIDIGTNTEITLKTREGLYSCSCASGPAFEGGCIKDGMYARPGAIHKVKINAKSFVPSYQTIDDLPPSGICGSGIIDVISEMVKAGIIDSRGRFNKENKQVTKNQKDEVEFILVPPQKFNNENPISITQKDINQIQLAKGAIQTGIDILLKSAGITSDMIQEIFLAGSFGNYLSPQSAINIGMLPHPIIKINHIGNAAGRGCKELLLSAKKRKLAEKLCRQINYVELSADPNFGRTFAQSLKFPSS